MRITWGYVRDYAARHGLDPEDMPTPAELAQDDRESAAFREAFQPTRDERGTS